MLLKRSLPNLLLLCTIHVLTRRLLWELNKVLLDFLALKLKLLMKMKSKRKMLIRIRRPKFSTLHLLNLAVSTQKRSMELEN
jgi:hypothetical protein